MNISFIVKLGRILHGGKIIFYEHASSKILFLPQENKIHSIFKPSWSTQATRANPSAFSGLESMYSGQVSPMTSDKWWKTVTYTTNTDQLSQCSQSCNLIFPVDHGNKLGTDIYVFNRRKYLNIIYYYQNYIIHKLTREIMENKPPLVPDVVFMNFMSGIFSSKTLMSI